MKANILERLERNELVAEPDKDAVRRFLKVASTVGFGKIAPRQEGYLFGDYKLPRCTSVLQMDGSKAGALMEWAKREVAGRIEHILTGKLIKGDPITEWVIADACKEGLVEPDRQRDQAADVGTETHDEIETYLTEDVLRDGSDGVLRFAEAWKRSGLTCIGTEIPVVWYDNNGLGFGGRLDILAYKDGRFYIGDNKTSRSVHESYGLQISSYAKGVEQMSHGAIKIAGGFIFHIPNLETLNERQKKEYNKRGSLIEVKNLNEAFEHYRLLLGLYNKRNNKYF